MRVKFDLECINTESHAEKKDTSSVTVCLLIRIQGDLLFLA